MAKFIVTNAGGRRDEFDSETAAVGHALWLQERQHRAEHNARRNGTGATLSTHNYGPFFVWASDRRDPVYVSRACS
jgi:hypothetical protein